MDLPFDGAISAFYENEAPDWVRDQIKNAKKNRILNPDYPYESRWDKDEYEDTLAALQIELVRLQAWVKDSGAPRVTREAAMAKLFATDHAQLVIDKAVQLFGGDGVRSGVMVESLYREIRALRIYEGASDVQRVIIARQAMSEFEGGL